MGQEGDRGTPQLDRQLASSLQIFERRNLYLRKRDSLLSTISEFGLEEKPELGSFRSTDVSFRERTRLTVQSEAEFEFSHLGSSTPNISNDLYPGGFHGNLFPGYGSPPSTGYNTFPRYKDPTQQPRDLDIYETQRRMFDDIYASWHDASPEVRDQEEMKRFVAMRMLDPDSSVSVATFSREALQFEAECLNAKRRGAIYFGFEGGRAVGVFVPPWERRDAQLSAKFKFHIDRAFQQNGYARLYIAQRAVHGPILTNLGPPGTHFYLITLEIDPPKTILEQEMFPVSLPEVDVHWGAPRVLLPEVEEPIRTTETSKVRRASIRPVFQEGSTTVCADWVYKRLRSCSARLCTAIHL